MGAGWLAAGCTGGNLASPAAGETDAGDRDTDAGADAHERADAAVVERSCDPAKPFDPPVPVKGLATAQHIETQARFTGDERIAYFQRVEMRANGDYLGTLYAATRSEMSEEFSAFKLTSPSATDQEDISTPSPTADGSRFFFARADLYPGLGRIWTASRSTSASELADVRELAGPVNDGESQWGPYVVPSSSLYFLRDRADGLQTLHRATRNAAGDYANVKAIEGLDMRPGQGDGRPVVTADELTIYWASDRLAVPGSTNIYVATRPDTTSRFSGVRRVTELGAKDRKRSPDFVSADGCRLYLTSLSIVPYESDILVASKPK